MKEYIERKAATNSLFAKIDEPNHAEFLYCDEIYNVIQDIPAADVVEVVRCRECKHGEYDDAIEDEFCYHCRYDGFSYNKADHFCSDGERKGGEQQ